MKTSLSESDRKYISGGKNYKNRHPLLHRKSNLEELLERFTLQYEGYVTGRTEKCKYFFRNYAAHQWLLKSFLQLENSRESGKNILIWNKVLKGLVRQMFYWTTGKIYDRRKYMVYRDFFQLHWAMEFMWKTGTKIRKIMNILLVLPGSEPLLSIKKFSMSTNYKILQTSKRKHPFYENMSLCLRLCRPFRFLFRDQNGSLITIGSFVVFYSLDWLRNYSRLHHNPPSSYFREANTNSKPYIIISASQRVT